MSIAIALTSSVSIAHDGLAINWELGVPGYPDCVQTTPRAKFGSVSDLHMTLSMGEADPDAISLDAREILSQLESTRLVATTLTLRSCKFFGRSILEGEVQSNKFGCLWLNNDEVCQQSILATPPVQCAHCSEVGLPHHNAWHQ